MSNATAARFTGLEAGRRCPLTMTRNGCRTSLMCVSRRECHRRPGLAANYALRERAVPVADCAVLNATLFIRSAYTAPMSWTAFATMSATTAPGFCGREVAAGVDGAGEMPEGGAEAFRRLTEASAAREIAEVIPPAEMAWGANISISPTYRKRLGVQTRSGPTQR